MAVTMEFTEYHSPDDRIYRFEATDKFLMSESGLGMPPIEYITQRSALQHGETVIGYRLTPRIIQLQHRRNACGRNDYWGNRFELMDLLRPNRQSLGVFSPGKLRKILPNDTVYDIDVFVEQGPVFAARDLSRWDEWAISETIRFVAHDPTFYDPNQQCYTSYVSTLGEDLIFPFTFQAPDGLLLGLSSLWGVLTIPYTGTWQSFPSIRIIGPINEPEITNISTGKVLALAYNVPIGQYVDISLAPGNKRLVDSNGVDRTYTLTEDSDLIDFAIEPEPLAQNGLNYITIVGTGITIGETAISIGFYTRFIGI